MHLLDPKLDVVFKMLFAEPRNRALLAALLTAVLRPSSPIEVVTVRDSELPKDMVTDRGLRLDVLVELADGRQIDVEMQCDRRGHNGNRWAYHWARLYGARLRRGDDWDDLKPVVCIVFLDEAEPSGRFHSLYEILEVHDHARLTEGLAIHLIELPRLEQAQDEGERVELTRWARFLRANSEAELDSLAYEVPIMAAAKEALEVLSREPSAQRLAQYREDAEIERRIERAFERSEGREEGRAEGLAKVCATLRESIVTLCGAFGLPVDEARRARLERADEPTLRAWFQHLAAHRDWPVDGPDARPR